MEEKKLGAKRLIKEFPGKRRPKTSITRLLQKIDNYATIKRKLGKHNNDVIVTLIPASVFVSLGKVAT